MSYGNILLIFDTPDKQQQVIDLILDLNLRHASVGNSIFVQTASPVQTENLSDSIIALDVKHILFHDGNPDSSGLRTLGLNADQVGDIKDILNV